MPLPVKKTIQESKNITPSPQWTLVKINFQYSHHGLEVQGDQAITIQYINKHNIIQKN